MMLGAMRKRKAKAPRRMKVNLKLRLKLSPSNGAEPVAAQNKGGVLRSWAFLL
jgi:hypothetical protein